MERDASVVRLRPELSKNREARTLLSNGPLKALIDRRRKARTLIGPGGESQVVQYVFHREGRRIGDWRKIWKKACTAARVPGKMFHDLRRTVARNLIRSGRAEWIAMAITAHKTGSVFDRYNIVSRKDIEQAMTCLADYVGTLPTNLKV